MRHARAKLQLAAAISRSVQLTLTSGFVGKYLEAVIRPKHNISDPGPETVAISRTADHLLRDQ